MDTQKITADYRLSQWAQIIQARLDSGQNVKNFCQAAGVKRSSYFYWQKKLRDAACTELAKVEENNKEIVPSGWTQLNPKQLHQVNESLDIEINGCHITVNAQTDPGLLKNVCRMLRSL